MSFVATASSRIVLGLLSTIIDQLTSLGVLAWDIGLTIYNTFAPEHPVGQVVAKGMPGYRGKWPEFIPPKEGDSRSCCPALNAMANHGILPRDGKNIKYTDINAAIRATFNFAPSFCFFVPHFYASKLSRSYAHDTINLSDFNVHNIIEHDASLTRHDAVIQPDQGVPAQDLIDDLLASGTGPNGIITAADLAAVCTRRRCESKAKNSQFSLSLGQKMFGSSNSATLLAHFGGIPSDLRVFLKEERLPDGWESKVRKPAGLTISTFNSTVFRIELGIDESPATDGKKHA
ncbi:chloroperoxidase-like protein [Rickenella mellea]|uniref:Chloroperoxidase-like protein n=1 Tax=Rickenella mellea TaxID=50990 RepID=A0A4Y7QKB9_9AGAM|nr:chloroperoxidase-like protein [Rickenella mellea]